jgi:hypothetical protein
MAMKINNKPLYDHYGNSLLEFIIDNTRIKRKDLTVTNPSHIMDSLYKVDLTILVQGIPVFDKQLTLYSRYLNSENSCYILDQIESSSAYKLYLLGL